MTSKVYKIRHRETGAWLRGTGDQEIWSKRADGGIVFKSHLRLRNYLSNVLALAARAWAIQKMGQDYPGWGWHTHGGDVRSLAYWARSRGLVSIPEHWEVVEFSVALTEEAAAPAINFLEV